MSRDFRGNFHILAAACLAVTCLAPLPSRASESQSWLTNSGRLKINDDWRLDVTQEMRFDEFIYSDLFLQNWSIGASRKLSRGFSAGYSFKREREIRGTGHSNEDRHVLDVNWGHGLPHGLDFDTRGRLEMRSFEEPAREDENRYRLRFRLRGRVGTLPLRPFVSTELFTSSRPRQYRNRFILGAEMELTRNASLLVGVMRQDTRHRTTIHALLSGLTLSF